MWLRKKNKNSSPQKKLRGKSSSFLPSLWKIRRYAKTKYWHTLIPTIPMVLVSLLTLNSWTPRSYSTSMACRSVVMSSPRLCCWCPTSAAKKCVRLSVSYKFWTLLTNYKLWHISEKERQFLSISQNIKERGLTMKYSSTRRDLMTACPLSSQGKSPQRSYRNYSNPKYRLKKMSLKDFRWWSPRSSPRTSTKSC